MQNYKFKDKNYENYSKIRTKNLANFKYLQFWFNISIHRCMILMN